MSLTEQEKNQAITELDKALSDITFTKEEAYEILKEAELDPDKIVNKHLLQIKKLQALAKIKIAKEKRGNADLLSLAKQMVANLKSKYKSNPKEQLNLVFENLGFQFRKLEEISDDDAIEMLEEAELLKLIKELDRKANEQ